MANSLEDLTVDQLLAYANNASVSHNTMNRLVNDPKTRERTLRLLKESNPSLSIPEIDAKDEVNLGVAGANEQIEKLRTQLMERDARDSIERDRKAIKDKYNLSDADVAEVEKLMVDKDAPIPYYDSAARVYMASRTQAMPSSSALAPPVFDMPDQNVWGGGIGNRAALDKIGMQQAYAALNEIKSGKVAGA